MRKTSADDTHVGSRAHTSYYLHIGHDDSSASTTGAEAASHIDHIPHGDRIARDPVIYVNEYRMILIQINIKYSQLGSPSHLPMSLNDAVIGIVHYIAGLFEN